IQQSTASSRSTSNRTRASILHYSVGQTPTNTCRALRDASLTHPVPGPCSAPPRTPYRRQLLLGWGQLPLLPRPRRERQRKIRESQARLALADKSTAVRLH